MLIVPHPLLQLTLFFDSHLPWILAFNIIGSILEIGGEGRPGEPDEVVYYMQPHVRPGPLSRSVTLMSH